LIASPAPRGRHAVSDIFDDGLRITALYGVPHGEHLEAFQHVEGKGNVRRIEPCQVSGTAGYMTWFRVVFDDGSDVIVSPNDIHSVHREPGRGATGG
jgi:hypothetical protein